MQEINKNAELYKTCSKCGREFNSGAVQKCVHPKVNEVYGKNICMYCCSKCKFVIPVGSGYTCKLLQEQNNDRKNGLQSKAKGIRKRKTASAEQQIKL